MPIGHWEGGLNRKITVSFSGWVIFSALFAGAWGGVGPDLWLSVTG